MTKLTRPGAAMRPAAIACYTVTDASTLGVPWN